MKTFKKTLISVICFILLLTLFSSLLIIPYLNSESYYYQDKYLRADLAGELDYLVVGASHCLTAIDPRVMDEILGCNSYNMSNVVMTLYGKEYLLTKELCRNPIDTVVIEVTFQTLLRDQSSEYAAADQVTMARLDSFAERAEYLTNYVKFDDWLNIYSRDLRGGLFYWREYLFGSSTHNVDYEKKGYYALPPRDLTLAKESALSDYNQYSISTEYLQDNIDQLVSLINLCKQKDVEVILAVVPISDRFIWNYDGWDEFYNWMKAFCDEHGCAFYDFNLLKNRYELFSDADSFSNDLHMSDIGAQSFTPVFSNVLAMAANGDEVSSLFFPSYEDMKTHSPYAVYLDS